MTFPPKLVMKYSVIILFILVGLAAIGDIDIGIDEYPANEPFCADCAVSLRYQTLYLEGELGNAIEIETISLITAGAAQQD